MSLGYACDCTDAPCSCDEGVIRLHAGPVKVLHDAQPRGAGEAAGSADPIFQATKERWEANDYEPKPLTFEGLAERCGDGKPAPIIRLPRGVWSGG
jgi:hypothetical protein